MRTFECAITVMGAALLLAGRVHAQDVIKPAGTTSTTGARLAAPTGLTSRQLADGRILIAWRPVAGAVSYSVWRSVQPAGITLVSEQQTDTAYYDTDVKAGSYYYFQVAAIGAGGTVGLKAAPPPVNATTSTATSGTTSAAAGGTAAATIAPPDTVIAFMESDGFAARVQVDYDGRPGLRLLLERLPAEDPKAAWVQRFLSPILVTGAPYIELHDPFDVPTGTLLQWRAILVDSVTGARSSPAYSVQVRTRWTTASSSLSCTASCPAGVSRLQTGPTSSSSSPPATSASTGNVLVSVGASQSLRVGATSALAGALGWTPLRWLSLDEGVATVDASGTVAGKSAGRAQVLAIGRASDGSARVTLVSVTVIP